MISLRKPTQSTGPTPVAVVSEDASTGKGRPTPKRSEREAANKRPLIPADRKEAKRADKTRRKEQRSQAYSGMQRGEERYLPERDRGPERRYVREFVDARRNLAEYFLPAALAFIFLNFLTVVYPMLAAIVIIALYLVVTAAVVDTIVMWARLKRLLLAKFGTVAKGTAMYAAMRAFQLRRSRMPKPKYGEHGHYPV